MPRQELDALDKTALGKLSILPEFKFGANLDIANAGTEDIWGSATAYVPLTANTQFEIASSSSDDKSTAGTGARTVKVYGLKADWTLAEETISMHATNGQTAVNLADTYMAIYRLKVMTAGSGGKNAGKITVKINAGADQCHIETGYNQSTHGHFPVPAGYTALIDSVLVSTDAASGVNAKVYVLDTLNNNLKTVKWNIQATGIPREFKKPQIVTEKSHIIWEATNGSGGTAFVSIDMDIRLVPNSNLRTI